MAEKKHTNGPLAIAEELRRDLIVRFLAEVMHVTGSVESQADFHAALQRYCDSL